MFTDSRYPFLVLHAHAAIWKERGFLMAKDTPIKIWTPDIIPPRGSTFAQGDCSNSLPGTSKGTARNNPVKSSGGSGIQGHCPLKEPFIGALIPSLPHPVPPPLFTLADRDWVIQRRYTLNPQWWEELNRKLHLPQFLSRMLSKGSTSLVILNNIICTRFAKRYLLKRNYSRQLNKYVMPVCFAPVTTLKEVGHPHFYNPSRIREAT